MKRILTIQDISCVGKCSLTIALPVISACGVETAVLPTAVLSTHTQFNGFTFRDLTDDMNNIKQHWLDQKIDFDAIYTGYLGSFEQVDIVRDYVKDFKNDDNFVLIDPVMADNGVLYKGFTQEFADKMTELCNVADVIVPNLTEASFMLHIPYTENYDKQYIEDILKKLTANGCKKAVLTGVSFEKGKLGVYGYDRQTDRYFSYFGEHLPVAFHGTGDLFASTLCGALARGKDLQKALEISVDFTIQCIKTTMNNPNKRWYGVDFENSLGYLIDKLK